MTGIVLPAYPYDRLTPLREKAAALAGGVVDLSIGTPTDPPPAVVLAALADADRHGALRGYPSSAGSRALLEAIQAWTKGRLGATVPLDALAACVGTKEFVATVPQWLKLRTPSRDTVLYPAVSYPTYAMGATLAGLRHVAVPVDQHGCLDLNQVDDADAERSLLLWVNTPGNPAGGLDDLPAAAAWGRARGVPVFSDECYAEFTWDAAPATVLGHGGGADGLEGVVALHSLSKRSNLAGMRVGWYAGDPEVVAYLREVRKHAGMMVPGPAQAAAVAALADQGHVDDQRARYRERLERMQGILSAIGVQVALPGGGFYLWAPAPGGDAWAFAEELAVRAGLLVSPGEFYGLSGAGHARLAMVAPLSRLDVVAERLGVEPSPSGP
ncbi:MAG: aminotransferase class I/II-fold pyridoxal phosphate-dependent enzyme [Acidimicrobiales bacterium]